MSGSSPTMARRSPSVALQQVLLIAAMAVGSVVMWLGVPVGLIYLASRMADSSQPSLGPYLVVLIGLPVGMFVVGKLLARLDHRYAKITHTDDDGRPVRAAWLKSLRAERGSGRKRSILDVVMIVSVAVAGLIFAVWFFAFAGSSLGN